MQFTGPKTLTPDRQEGAMITTVTPGVARADGADLYFELRGDGPPLLMIAGGGGDGGAFRP